MVSNYLIFLLLFLSQVLFISDVKCMSTVKLLKEELKKLLKNKQITKELLSKPESSETIKMDYKFQK